MTAVLAIALLPVALGVGLGLLPAFQHRMGGPARTFALAAAATVVFAELLPDSVAALGLPAFALFGAGLLAPAALEWLARLLHRGAGAGTLLALGAVAVHQVVDGLEIGASWHGPSGPAVALSIGAHAVPLVAVVVQREGLARPRRVAAVAGALLVATAAGVVAGARGARDVPGLHDWLPAVVAGLLLHVMAHSLDARAPRRPTERLAELAAGGLGVAVPLALLTRAPEGAETLGLLLDALSAVTLQVAPLLVLGLVAAASLRPQRLSGRAATAGPVALGAFVFAAPALGPEALVLSVGLLGVPVAAARLVLVGAGALGAGWLLGRMAGPAVAALARAPSPPRRPLGVVRDRALALGPWVVASLLLAATARAFVPYGALVATAGAHLDLVGAAAFAAPVTWSATAAMPLAAVAWAGGASATAVLVGLTWGPGLGLPALTRAAHAVGLRAVSAAAVTFAALTLAGSAAVGALLGDVVPPSAPAPGLVARGAAILLAGVGLDSLWRAGPRAWAAQLVRPTASPPGPASGPGQPPPGRTGR